MSIEEDIVAELATLFDGRVYPDTAPPSAEYPFCVYQQVGGVSVATLCGSGSRNARIQFWVWAKPAPDGGGRSEASTLMRSLAAALTDAPLRAVPIGELVARYDDVTRTYGAQQDFSFWF